MEWGAPAAISISAGVICLIAGILNWTVGRRKWPIVTLVLILSGSTAILAGPIGAWVGGLLSTVDGWLGSMAGQLTGAVVIAGLIGLFIVYPLILKLVNKDIDTKALVLAGMAPLGVTVIPAGIGTIIATALGWVAFIVTWPIAAAFGWT